MVLHLVHFHLQPTDVLVGLLGVELRDALNLDLCKLNDILGGNLAPKHWLKRIEPTVDGFDYRLPCLALLYGVVDAVLDKYLFERRHVPPLLQLAQADVELHA